MFFRLILQLAIVDKQFRARRHMDVPMGDRSPPNHQFSEQRIIRARILFPIRKFDKALFP